MIFTIKSQVMLNLFQYPIRKVYVCKVTRSLRSHIDLQKIFKLKP